MPLERALFPLDLRDTDAATYSRAIRVLTANPTGWQNYLLGHTPEHLARLRGADPRLVAIVAYGADRTTVVGAAEICCSTLSFLVAAPFRHRGIAGMLARATIDRHLGAFPHLPLSAYSIRDSLDSRRILESLSFETVSTQLIRLAPHRSGTVVFYRRR